MHAISDSNLQPPLFYCNGFSFRFRWKNWVIRGIFTWLMIGGFGVIIYGGPLLLMLTVSY